MGLFSKGDNVTVTSDNYPAEDGKSFTGKSGTVTSTRDDSVAVRLDGDNRTLAFMAEELTPKQ